MKMNRGPVFTLRSPTSFRLDTRHPTPDTAPAMLIWLLAVLILAALAGLGYRQGGVRVAFSLVGIFAALLLARPLGKLVRLLMVVMGVKNLILLGILPPLIGFIIVSLCFKAGAVPVHHKVDVYFKYHAGDLRLALWERLHHRL